MAALPLYSPQDGSGESGARRGGGSKSSDKSAATCGVRYGAMNWIGDFRLPGKLQIPCGAHVVIQTDRGIELGEPARLTCQHRDVHVSREQIRKYASNTGPDFYRLKAGRILREASPQDIDEHQRLNVHVRDDIDRCRETADRLELGMKIITAEHLLGGERIVFYFSSEGRVDFRELVRELAQYYQTRIEMRQVGARDEARLIADYEVCGRECCCKNFLKKLRPVTMRMAKLQKSTLDPSKVSGRCGRLRCCLRYEHEGYDELSRKLPRMGARVQTESGPATVIDRQVLTQLVLVRDDDGQVSAIPFDELRPPDAKAPTPGKPEKKPQPPPKKDDKPVDEAKPASGKPEQAEENQRPSRSQRRSRRRRQQRGDAGGKPAERPAEKPSPPAGDAKPGKAPEERKSGNEAPEDGKSSSKDARRRRRRRRSRRGKGDAPPDSSS